MERAFATDFLTGSDHEHDAACLARLRGHAADRGNKGGNTALHVSCAAAIELAIDDVARERIKIPRSITERNGIDMAGEAKRRLSVVAANSGDQVGPVLAEAVHGSGEARGSQNILEVPDAGEFAAGRIDRVESDQLARQF